jgi:hypothetical protein
MASAVPTADPSRSREAARDRPHPAALHVLGASVGSDRPAIGDVVTIAIRGGVAFELKGEVVAYEGDGDREVAILVDQLGCRWAMPVPPAATSAAAA